ncbi:hypothetical protein TG4357_00713 [Thalassovita gelatinovora]|uniref:Uncharacterized protein n=1 Tax=Thalassovita gelatinovora TaxID=53501 RepID=A0A0P1F6H3_THAGE|nr:hypothetical protein TG4357_00713 [Thalassovita gelatinovora]SEQ68058.1 hypothetical protein SAMN04488043_107217 [Thalassovita gelatinovora]
MRLELLLSEKKEHETSDCPAALPDTWCKSPLGWQSAEPIMEPEVIVAEAASSSSDATLAMGVALLVVTLVAIGPK